MMPPVVARMSMPATLRRGPKRSNKKPPTGDCPPITWIPRFRDTRLVVVVWQLPEVAVLQQKGSEVASPQYYQYLPE
jgi:hypothetical protein